MFPWLRSVLVSRDLWVGIVGTVVLFVLGKFIAMVVAVARNIRRYRQSYDISGFWIGECISSKSSDGRYIDIWRFSQRGEQIQLTGFSYDQNGNDIETCEGHGVFRSSYLSAYWFVSSRQRYETGTLFLKNLHERLEGKNMQVDVRDAREDCFEKEYKLFRLQLPTLRKWKWYLFHGLPFQNKDEAADQWQRITQKQKENPMSSQESHE